MNKHKWMTEEEFKGIKMLLETGLTVATIAKATSRSNGTVAKVNEFETFEEYKNPTEAPKEEEPVEITSEITNHRLLNQIKYIQDEMVRAFEQQAKDLDNINKALAELSKKKGLFR